MFRSFFCNFSSTPTNTRMPYMDYRSVGPLLFGHDVRAASRTQGFPLIYTGKQMFTNFVWLIATLVIIIPFVLEVPWFLLQSSASKTENLKLRRLAAQLTILYSTPYCVYKWHVESWQMTSLRCMRFQFSFSMGAYIC